MIVSIISAASDNNVIGLQGDLPWHMPNDLRFFKRSTLGHHIIMGRKTYTGEGINKPLPKRVNIVLSRNPNLTLPGAIVVSDIVQALNIAKAANETEAFIIGGSEIYTLAMPWVQKIYLTRIHTQIAGDTFFPPIPANFVLTHSKRHPADKKHAYAYTFTTWERKA